MEGLASLLPIAILLLIDISHKKTALFVIVLAAAHVYLLWLHSLDRTYSYLVWILNWSFLQQLRKEAFVESEASILKQSVFGIDSNHDRLADLEENLSQLLRVTSAQYNHIYVNLYILDDTEESLLIELVQNEGILLGLKPEICLILFTFLVDLSMAHDE